LDQDPPSEFGIWLPLNFNLQQFGEDESPSSTIVPKTIISSTYTIFASPGGLIGDKFIKWIRVRSTAKTLGSGIDATGDLVSLWAVANVITLD
jgi:hypothetical protein